MKKQHKNYADQDYVVDNAGIKHSNSKIEYELFKDEENVAEKVVRVRRTVVGKNERWKIFEDGKIVFTVEGLKLTKGEREFLRTPAGCSFLIAQGRNGIKSFSGFRKQLKLVLA